MRRYFADSFYFLALLNPKDSFHRRAMELARSLQGSIVTTDWILMEVADALSGPTNRSACVGLINDLRISPSVHLEPATRYSFEAGWAVYQQRADKGWSLTDCISFVVMQEYESREALTGDRHFEQAGFARTMA